MSRRFSICREAIVSRSPYQEKNSPSPSNIAPQYGAEVKRLTATMVLRARPFSDSALARLHLQMPFTSLKVIAAIHWQVVKLFCRGAKFFSEPNLPHAPIITGSGE